MSKNNALVISPRFPLPLKSGTQLRVFYTLKELNKQYDLTLLALVQNSEGKNRISDIKKMGVEVIPINIITSKKKTLFHFITKGRSYRESKFYNNELYDAANELINSRNYDFTWVHFLETLPLLPKRLPSPIILDQHNSDIDYWEKYGNESITRGIFSHINISRIKEIQEDWINEIDMVLSVSPENAQMANQWASDTTIHVVPNGVDVSEFSPSRPSSMTEKNVVFIGSLDRKRNIEAIDWFISNAWERIYEQHPDSKFKIIGRNPGPKMEKLSMRSGVQVIGEVPNIPPYYDQASIAIAPFILGSGTKLKILESLSMARPIVTSPTGVSGIDVVDEKHGLVRDRDASFADAVVNLLSSPRRRDRIGKNGRGLVLKKYSWESIMQDILEKID